MGIGSLENISYICDLRNTIISTTRINPGSLRGFRLLIWLPFFNKYFFNLKYCFTFTKNIINKSVIKETRHINIKNNQTLQELSNYTGISREDLKGVILRTLLNNGYIADEIKYCGTKLVIILMSSRVTLRRFSQLCFKVSYDRLVELLKNIVVWGIEGDCPLCGCETYMDDYDKVCVNNCEYRVSLIPENEIILNKYLIPLN